MSKVIETKDLVKRFGGFIAVDKVSLTVGWGEVLGFLGPNGAGKSTTMKMITGFMTPDNGSVSIAGFDVATAPLEAKRCIGYLPEGAPAYPDMTPKQFLRFIAQARGLSPDNFNRRLAYVVERVSIQSVMHQPIETLSKGFKRRLGLAQAILHDPAVLILDEPTDGLDPNQKFEVRSLISEIAAEKAIIISTHILEEVDALCSRAVIINRGRLVADGTPQSLENRSRYAGAVTIVFEDSAETRRQTLLALPGVADLEVSGSTIEQCTIFPESGEIDLLSTVHTAVSHHNWQPRVIRLARGRLDDVFRDVTKGEAA